MIIKLKCFVLLVEIDDQCNTHGTCKLKVDQERQCVEIKCDCFIGYSGDKCEVEGIGYIAAVEPNCSRSENFDCEKLLHVMFKCLLS